MRERLRLVRVAQLMVAEGTLDEEAPLRVLSDILGAMAVDEVEAHWEVVEALLNAEGAANSRGELSSRSKLIFVQAMKDLKVRSVAYRNEALVARVMAMWSNLLSLTERSGLNVKGNFREIDPTDVEMSRNDTQDKESPQNSIDKVETFGHELQKFERMIRTRELTDEERNSLLGSVKELLEIMESKSFSGERLDPGGNLIENRDEMFCLFSEKTHLLNRQLEDPLFRRQVLVEIALTIDRVDENNETGNLAVAELRQRTDILFHQTTSPGDQFSAVVASALQLDEEWRSWRPDFKSFEKPRFEFPMRGEFRASTEAGIPVS